MAEASSGTGDVQTLVWASKYRDMPRSGPPERSVEDSHRRIAGAVSSVEPRDRGIWESRFRAILKDYRFLPGGRILAGAGTDRTVTLFNCFVMGVVEDSIPGIFRALEEGAVTMQHGGGIGVDFSTLRPRGTRTKGAGTVAMSCVAALIGRRKAVDE